MSAYTLPLRSDLTNYTFQCDLDGTTYGFEFRWNERDLSWYMSISDASGNPLHTGRRVLLGVPLAFRSRVDGMPPGQFVAVDTSGQDLDAGLNDLGSRVVIVYLDASEF